MTYLLKKCCSCSSMMVINSNENGLVCKICNDYACSICRKNKEGQTVCKKCENITNEKYPLQNKANKYANKNE